MNIIGDVDQKTAIIFDDMVDTAGTLCNAAAALKEKGALKTVAYAAHPVLSGPAIERIADSELDELVVTDTIPLTKEAKDTGKIRQLSIAELLGENNRENSGRSIRQFSIRRIRQFYPYFSLASLLNFGYHFRPFLK